MMMEGKRSLKFLRGGTTKLALESNRKGTSRRRAKFQKFLYIPEEAQSRYGGRLRISPTQARFRSAEGSDNAV